MGKIAFLVKTLDLNTMRSFGCMAFYSAEKANEEVESRRKKFAITNSEKTAYVQEIYIMDAE